MDLLAPLLWIALLANLAFFPFYAYLLVVSLAALLRPRRRFTGQTPRQRFLVAIPAHDEEAGITATIRSCLALDYPEELFEVVVIADNCSDRTAALVRQEGVSVLERFHPTDRSKGHALKYLFDRLFEAGQVSQLDAVVIVDADSVVDPRLLTVFASRLDLGHDWIQAFNTVSNTGDSWRTRLMTYSFGLINGVVLQGQTALGLSGGFRGNGMCFSIRGLNRRPWRTYGLVEDLEYSWSLRVEGEKIDFAPEAVVYATMLAQGGPAAANQRRRWESGRRDLKLRMLGPIWRSAKLGTLAKIAAIIELQMPALVVLALFWLISTLFALICSVNVTTDLHASLLYRVCCLDAFAALGLILYGLAPFYLFSLDWDVIFCLIHVPIYAIWKLSMAFHRPPREWIRTAREPRTTTRVSPQAGGVAPH